VLGGYPLREMGTGHPDSIREAVVNNVTGFVQRSASGSGHRFQRSPTALHPQHCTHQRLDARHALLVGEKRPALVEPQWTTPATPAATHSLPLRVKAPKSEERSARQRVIRAGKRAGKRAATQKTLWFIGFPTLERAAARGGSALSPGLLD